MGSVWTSRQDACETRQEPGNTDGACVVATLHPGEGPMRRASAEGKTLVRMRGLRRTGSRCPGAVGSLLGEGPVSEEERPGHQLLSFHPLRSSDSSKPASLPALCSAGTWCPPRVQGGDSVTAQKAVFSCRGRFCLTA